jgi:hypothetical protein
VGVVKTFQCNVLFRNVIYHSCGSALQLQVFKVAICKFGMGN